MDDRADVLGRNIALTKYARARAYSRSLSRDRVLQALVRDLVAARIAAGMTQEEVAARMGSTRSAVSRLESGVGTRPTLRTIERYAFAAGARVEIRVRSLHVR
jgi:DNA-binding XRE family transcriptional regulator